MTINLDIETTSGADLKKCGVYVYAADPDFAIQLLAYSIDGGRVEQVDFTAGELMSEDLQDLLLDPNVTKRAYNASFERICLSSHLLFPGEYIDPEGWECTLVRASASGLPGSLDEVSKALGLGDGIAKKDGKRYIKLFAVGRANPADYPEDWQAYKDYNKTDVVAEMAIRAIIDRECPFTDQAIYELDQRINDAGVMLDIPFIETVISMEAKRRDALEVKVKSLTWLKNPNSPAALLVWLNNKLDLQLTSADKASLATIDTEDPIASEVLAARRELSLSSVKKFTPMRAGACEDGRARGLFRCYGAGRTGRWSSVRVQLQNLARGDGKLDLGLAKNIISMGNLWLVEACYSEPMAILSSLVRPALIPSPGNELIVGDFSSIEARIIAWLAGEQWALDVFAGDGAIYEAAAARMYGVPVEDIVAGVKAGDPDAVDKRSKGKIATLALGYQGAVGALTNMGAAKMGMREPEMDAVVTAWRKANPKIVDLWRNVENAAKACILRGTRIKVNSLIFSHANSILKIQLPSGRSLVYRGVRLIGAFEATDHLGRLKICGELTYEGYSTLARVWGRQKTYGGKLAENATQAIARDCLAEAMLSAAAADYKIVMHVHDEIVADMPKGTGPSGLKEIMSRVPAWATGLPLSAKVEVSEYYSK